MRKVVMFNRVTLDGFFAGPNGEIDWFINDPELDKTVRSDPANREIMRPDTVLLGRVTYQLFESYWPKVNTDQNASKEEKSIANELSQMTKVVFSSTLKEANWENTRIVKSGVVEEVKKLKQSSGLDMIIFGSGTIVAQLTAEGLIDEYLFAITPITLGAGKSLFTGVKKQGFEPLETKYFKSGNVLLRYKIK